MGTHALIIAPSWLPVANAPPTPFVRGATTRACTAPHPNLSAHLGPIMARTAPHAVRQNRAASVWPTRVAAGAIVPPVAAALRFIMPEAVTNTDKNGGKADMRLSEVR